MDRRPGTRSLDLARWASGLVFVAFGIGKFVNHAAEAVSFDGYGLPAPGTVAYVIGIVEIAGGALLLAGVGVRPAALVLAGNMATAIVVSGFAKGELISLTLAPALLLVMILLVLFERPSTG